MERNRTLSTTISLLLAVTLLTVSLIEVSAVPDSPYIMVVPEETWDSDSPDLTPGNYYTIAIITDYNATDSGGDEIWSWQFELTFNPAVLHGVEVLNGDLINATDEPSARFRAGDFNNITGRLSLTYAYFKYSIPPPATTPGPGTLAYVNFTVVGFGSSDITLTYQTQLLVYDSVFEETYALIDAFYAEGQIIPPYGKDHIGHGYFCNQAGDANWDHKADVWDLYRVSKAYGSEESDPNWDAYCDFDRDLDVDSSDLSGLASNYGEWP